MATVGIGAALAIASTGAAASGAGLASSPAFFHEGGPVVMRHVRLKAGSTRIDLLEDAAQVNCRSGVGTGTIAGSPDQHLITDLQITFRSCFAKNNIDGKTCPVHSLKDAEGAATKEISTGRLEGELVPVAFPETFSGVGLLIGPRNVRKPFLAFEASPGDDCLPLPKAAQRRVPVYGRVIAEVGATYFEVRTDSIDFEIEGGDYLEERQRIQKPQSLAQQVLSAFGGVEAPLASAMTLRFEEGVEISG